MVSSSNLFPASQIIYFVVPSKTTFGLPNDLLSLLVPDPLEAVIYLLLSG
jgi:hypothetical protein